MQNRADSTGIRHCGWMAWTGDDNAESDDGLLLALFAAIASRDRLKAEPVWHVSPDLANRQMSGTHFLGAIGHYLYRGDTALHVAAAAHQPELAAALVGAGADVSSRNRRGAEPLHYAADGSPGADYWDPAA